MQDDTPDRPLSDNHMVDTDLLRAAQTDVALLRDHYINAVHALEKAALSEDDIKQHQSRLEQARALLAQALVIQEFATEPW